MLQRKTTVSTCARRKAATRAKGLGVLALLLFAGFAGCGQKGPLTLSKPLPAASAPAR